MARPTITLNPDALRTARARAGLTQEALAEAVKVTPGAIGLIETGRRQPGAPLLERIAAAVDTPAAELATIAEAGAA